MNVWSNIEVSPDDQEILMINNLEEKLGELPDKIIKIRELITRFEACHFKYKQHIRIIKDSITNLESGVNSAKIGLGHIQHGENAWKNDTTGRSLVGQQYVWALKDWLSENSPNDDRYDTNLGKQIRKWLGNKDTDKIRLVRLLLARLTWDWTSYEKLQCGGKFKDIEFQACRMDICHYAFPKNLNLLIQEIGKMKAVEAKSFEGCGSYNNAIKAYLEKEFIELNGKLKSLVIMGKTDKKNLFRAWLVACLAKTIKEHISLSIPVTDLVI